MLPGRDHRDPGSIKVIAVANCWMPRMVLAVCLLAITAARSIAQPPPRGVGSWKLETLRLRDGTEFRGLIQSRGEKELDFAEIVQRPGQPTFAIVRGVDVRQVAKIDALPASEHAELEQRFRQFRHRAVIEAGRMDAVRLEPSIAEEHEEFLYRGTWFILHSTADEESTRRCVVCMEQVFRAYRTLLPPRNIATNSSDQPSLQIYLDSSLDEYRGRLKKLGLSLTSPAFYSPRQRMIIAGSEMSAFARRLAETRGEMQRQEAELERLEKAFPASLSRIAETLREQGFADQEIAAELQTRRNAWKGEKALALSRLQEQSRRNEARFADVTREMFARLYHEAFHAYLDRHVYPRDEHHVPSWLHEGLAQVFEAGELEGDSLRIDSPNGAQLASLREEFGSANPLPLERLLATEERSFVDEQPGAETARNYRYAWGVAHYLVFERNLLGSPALDRYVSRESAALSPTVRFEQLVGQRMDKFEPAWRESILKLPMAKK